MANKTETATFNVKSNIGEVTKDASSLAGEFRVMGVSLNSVKAGLTSVGKTAKASFATIKAGIMSTGIGALVIAIGALASYFTNTKRGADKLSQAFTAMGAVVDVLTDRLSKVGEALTFVFSGDFRKAGELLKGTFAGITDEINKEVKAMVELKKRTQELRDADMDFMVQKAKTRQEIEKARLIAEDETKSAAERLTNLKKALELEAETTEQEIALAKERMLIQQQEMALSENLVEDEEKLARLKTEIIEKETASIKMRRRVVTEVNALEREIAAEGKARAKEKQDEIDAENKRLEEEAKKKQERAIKEAAILLALEQENSLALIKDLEERTLAELKIQEDKEIASAELLENSELVKAEIFEKFARKRNDIEKEFEQKELAEAKKAADEKIALEIAVKDAKLNIAGQTLGLIGEIAGEGSKVAKAAAVAQATISGVQGVQNAFTTASASPITSVFPAYPFVQAGLAGAFSALQIQKIMSGSKADSSGGGGGGGGMEAQTPAPQMMSGAFQLGGGIEPEPTRAYVVTDEMTNSQNQLANIRRRATI